MVVGVYFTFVHPEVEFESPGWLMPAAVGTAAAGIFLAWLTYQRRSIDAASLASAFGPIRRASLAKFWGRKHDHLEIADAICYDGTPWHKERAWSETNGFIGTPSGSSTGEAERGDDGHHARADNPSTMRIGGVELIFAKECQLTPAPQVMVRTTGTAWTDTGLPS